MFHPYPTWSSAWTIFLLVLLFKSDGLVQVVQGRPTVTFGLAAVTAGGGEVGFGVVGGRDGGLSRRQEGVEAVGERVEGGGMVVSARGRSEDMKIDLFTGGLLCW